jgi:hypothetical protein
VVASPPPPFLTSLLQGGREPIKTFIETIPCGGTTSLDVPLSVTETMEAKLVSHLRSTHGIWKILFVSKDEEDGVTELILIEHTVQFITGCEVRL